MARNYGIRWENDGHTPADLVLTSNLELKGRVCRNGEWSDWVTLSIKRNADGSVGEQVGSAAITTNAQTANKLKNPIKLTLSGDAAGEVLMDGSIPVTLRVDISKLAEMEKRLEALEKKVG